MARPPNVGDGRPLGLTVPAGLYHFLTLHARRAIYGKSESEIALYMIQQQATAWDASKVLGVGLPAEDFPATESDQPSKGS